MKEIINGIDVSEEIRYCNNCSHLGLDFKAHKFYCSLSHRPDELPEVLSCDEFSTNCYIKRLQEENERLQMLSCANCGEKYLSPDGAELYEKNVQLKQALEEIREIINKQKPTLDKAISQSEFTLERLCNYEEKYIKIVDKINEVLND